jgi:hypothetical protein
MTRHPLPFAKSATTYAEQVASTIYRLVHNGELELVKIGKRSSGITATSLHAMIERNKMPC